MANEPTTNGLLDRATKFGERFGFPSLITVILLCSLLYAGYFVMKYEVLYTREKVEAMSESVSTMHDQHNLILTGQEAALEMQSKQLKIQCGMCWNAANGQEEIKRCNCTPATL